MVVYRIVKSRARIQDLSGTGAFNHGGRWNFEGTYALYTSEHRSLALLETLVHTEENEMPPNLFILNVEVDDDAPVYVFPVGGLPDIWRSIDNYSIRQIGDQLLKSNRFIALKVPSAVLPQEFNYILNPSFPGFENRIRIQAVELYDPDMRLF